MIVSALALVFFLQSASPSPAPSPAAVPSAVPSAAPTAAPTPPPLPPLVAADIVALVQKTKEFGADSGRTALAADPAKRLGVPGVNDMGYFVEIQWKDKEGAAHTGVAVVAHQDVKDVPWMVKAEPWGLVKVLEDKTIEGIAGDLKRARLAANEAVAVNDTKMIYTAEMLFMAAAGGSYGDLRCLNIPADCIADIPGEKLLEKSMLVGEKSGYRRKFHHGARVAAPNAKGSPSPFVKSYAYTSVPVTPGESGVRSFCGDATGHICVNADGSAPPVVDGECKPCTELK